MARPVYRAGAAGRDAGFTPWPRKQRSTPGKTGSGHGAPIRQVLFREPARSAFPLPSGPNRSWQPPPVVRTAKAATRTPRMVSAPASARFPLPRRYPAFASGGFAVSKVRVFIFTRRHEEGKCGCAANAPSSCLRVNPNQKGRPRGTALLRLACEPDQRE